MRPVRVTVSGGTGSSAPIPLDQYISPFSVGIGCDISAGGNLTYTVEHTFDDVFAKTFTPAGATWFPNSGLTTKIADADGNYSAPVTAVRLTVTIWAAGSVTMTVIQAGVA